MTKKTELSYEEFRNSVWSLIFSMVERGIEGDDAWWGQDFLIVRRQLEEMGLNCDPEKVPEMPVDPVGAAIVTEALKGLRKGSKPI
jgi:hypothetical protein